MNGIYIFPAGYSAAGSQACGYLSARGFQIVGDAAPDVTHLMLPIPSFESDGRIRGGGILEHILADLPEDNGEDTVAKRKELSDEIKAKTELMERMYPLYEKFLSLNEDITEEDIQSLEHSTDDNESTDEKDSSGSESGTDNLEGRTKEELQKMRKSVATKIGRAKNMLEYQQETKAETPNPMPESPKKVKYETKIANLTKELEQIDYAIAKLGW